MGNALLQVWPFLLLIAVFVGFSIYMLRAMGTGKEGSYTSLMKRQLALTEAQIEQQAQMLAEMRRQSDALMGRLDERLSVRNAHEGRKYTLSLSVGIATYNPTDPVSLDELQKRIDRIDRGIKKFDSLVIGIPAAISGIGDLARGNPFAAALHQHPECPQPRFLRQGAERPASR